MTMSLGPGIAAGLLVSLVGVANPPSVAAQGDPCALLTQAEAAAILGQSIGAPFKGGSGECHYGEEGGAAEIVVYPMPLGFQSKEKFHAFVVEDTEAMNARIKKSMEKTGVTVKETAVEPVAQVGDAAYYVDPSLIVLSHSRVLNITAGNRDQAVAVARMVVPRIK